MRIFFLRITKFVLSWFNSLLRQIDYFIMDHLFLINQRLKTNAVGNLHAKASNVIEEAKKHSENSVFEQKERDFVYYHYLMKYYTAVYESYFGIVPPIQIFNEHRMSLDHIIRAKEKDTVENMGKATDHALRGLLDILKLNCAGLRKKIQKEHKKYPSKLLGLVSNGDYIKMFVELQNKAETSMFEAKLGESERIKTDVAKKFIYAFEAHDEWLQFQQEYRGTVIAVYAKYRTIRAMSFLFWAITSVITAVIACYIWEERMNLINYFFAK